MHKKSEEEKNILKLNGRTWDVLQVRLLKIEEKLRKEVILFGCQKKVIMFFSRC